MQEGKSRLFDQERGMRLFESLLENRTFAFALLIASLVSVFASLAIFKGSTLLSQSNPFVSADIYKISLFVNGVSPYSTEPWAAPYPPFYFILWSAPYIFLRDVLHLSLSGIFAGFRLISVLAFCACAYLIYKSQVIDKGKNSERAQNKAISCAALFLLSSLVAIIYPVGDALGLLLLAGACIIFASKSKNSTWIGVLLVSLAVAFKIHPILGALLLLTYYFYSERGINVRRVSKILTNSLFAFLGVMAALVIVPVAVIPGALNSFVAYNAENIQHYTFNVYAALYDIALNVAPSSFNTFSIALDGLWILLSALLVIFIARALFSGKDGITKGKFSLSSYSLDVLSLGILAWLLVLKQTMPHYFLWAIVPLLARGRTRSLYYVLAAELFGMIFFGLAQAFTTNFFSLTGALATVPGLGVSLLLLVGGILFDAFIIIAMKQLILEMKSEPIKIAEDLRIEQKYS